MASVHNKMASDPFTMTRILRKDVDRLNELKDFIRTRRRNKAKSYEVLSEALSMMKKATGTI